LFRFRLACFASVWLTRWSCFRHLGLQEARQPPTAGVAHLPPVRGGELACHVCACFVRSMRKGLSGETIPLTIREN
jgi:hypothetical protein